MSSNATSQACLLARRSYREDSLVAHTPYMHFSVFLLCFTLLFFLSTNVALLLVAKSVHSSAVSWVRIILLDLTCVINLLVGPVRDIVGYERFACDIELWLRTLQIFCLLGGFNLEIALLRSKVNLSRLLNQANFKTLQDFVRKDQMLFDHIASFGRHNSKMMVAPAVEEKGIGALESQPKTDYLLKQELSQALWTNSVVYQALLGSVVNLVPMALCCIVLQLSQPFYGQNCVNCLLVAWHYLVILLFGAMPFAWIVFGMRKLRKEPDPLNTVRNINRDAAIMFPFSALAILLYCINPHRMIDLAVFSPDWLSISVYLIVHYLLVPHQIYLAMQRNASATKTEFAQLLQDPAGLAAFTNHLQSEFNTENIRFYTHAKAFRENFHAFPNGALTRLAADEIYWTFVHPGSVLEINIPGEMRADIQTKLATPQRDLFARAEREIFELMQKDPFSRFTRTKEYKDWGNASRFNALSAASSPMVSSAF